MRRSLVALAVSIAACSSPRPAQSPEQKAVLGVIGRSTTHELRKLCKADDAMACAALGIRAIDFHGHETRMGDAEARAALEKSCAAGEVWGCYWLGRFLRDSGHTDDWEKGKALIERACAGGLALCSATTGSTRHAGRSGVGPAMFQKVMGDYLEPKCVAGSAASCLVLGRDLIAWEYSGARSEGGDFERASALFRRGCELGLSTACLYEGYLQEASLVRQGGRDLAVARYGAACRMGDAVGCHLASDPRGLPATEAAPPGPSASGSVPVP